MTSLKFEDDIRQSYYQRAPVHDGTSKPNWLDNLTNGEKSTKQEIIKKLLARRAKM